MTKNLHLADWLHWGACACFIAAAGFGFADLVAYSGIFGTLGGLLAFHEAHLLRNELGAAAEGLSQ